MKRPAEIVDPGLPVRLLRDAQRHPEFWHQKSVIRLMALILEAMEAQSVTQAELARRADLKPSYLSRIMNHPENITMRTAFRLCNALDLELGFDIRPKEEPAFADKPVRKPKVTRMPPPVKPRKRTVSA
jgi:DNA-binding Xre family transcriptional regulator